MCVLVCVGVIRRLQVWDGITLDIQLCWTSCVTTDRPNSWGRPILGPIPINKIINILSCLLINCYSIFISNWFYNTRFLCLLCFGCYCLSWERKIKPWLRKINLYELILHTYLSGKDEDAQATSQICFVWQNVQRGRAHPGVFHSHCYHKTLNWCYTFFIRYVWT